MTNIKRTVSIILVIAIIFVMLISSLYIVKHSAHECTIDHCATCASLNTCKELLKTSFQLIFIIITSSIVYLLFIGEKSFCNYMYSYNSLISLKTKLSC